jgi:hypothetical protein
LRERHGLRVPAHLAQAHARVGRREAELDAGFGEYGYLALLDVAAPSRGELEEACRAVVELAARCGLAEVRALHGRHGPAFAAALGVGRAPGRALLGGRP